MITLGWLVLAAMVEIPGGLHQPFLNQPSGKAAEPVQVAPFSLDKRPVTQREFATFVARHRQWQRSQVKRMFAEVDYLKNWEGDLRPNAPDTPVTFVSWFAANAYCKAAGMQLPTTDQWDYAADAGGRNKREVAAQTLAWYGKPTPATLPAVGGPPNAFGLTNMVDLIWEWTLDYASIMVGDEGRGGGESGSSLFCGGGGTSGADPADYASFMRFALRSSLKPSFTLANLGFRCAK